MDFSTFSSDLLAGFLGSGIGFFLGLRVDRYLGRKKTEARDQRLVQNLINRLAGKRAFGHNSEVGEVDNNEDREYCARSILDARQRILAVCDEIGEREDVIPRLRMMEEDCMAYLNYSEQEPLKYAMGLVCLREKLAYHQGELKKLMSALRPELPGARDSGRPDWLPS